MVLNGRCGHYQHWIDSITKPLSCAISSTDVRPSAAPGWLIPEMPLAFSGEPYCGSWITTTLRSEGTLSGLILQVCLRFRVSLCKQRKGIEKREKHKIQFWSLSSLFQLQRNWVHALGMEAAAPCKSTSATNPSTKTWPVAADLNKAYRARRSWAGNLSPGTAQIASVQRNLAWAAWVASVRRP